MTAAKNPNQIETYRPRFHFTARSGWLNDPNGLVHHGGEYHLFFQHNPRGIEHGDGQMTWGHAVSRNLVRWRQLGNAIEPYGGGDIWSGSAVVDARNTSGLQQGADPPLVAFFTHAVKPFGQAMAYSTDRGRSWRLFDGGRNVVPNQGLSEAERDPRVLWHEPSRRWVMVIWAARGIARFFTSTDLKRWKFASDWRLGGFYECPDLFELPVEDSAATRWILHDASFRYYIGSFDGRRFVAESGPLRCEVGRNFYAAQTWTNVPGRVVQIGWMRGGEYPGMPFNQQMSFPCELTLEPTLDGLLLHRRPVRELVRLRSGLVLRGNRSMGPGVNLFDGIQGEAFEVQFVFRCITDADLMFTSYGQKIAYSPRTRILTVGSTAVPLMPVDGSLALHVLIDRTSIEVFANNGVISVSECFVPATPATGLRLETTRGTAIVRHIKVFRLASDAAGKRLKPGQKGVRK